MQKSLRNPQKTLDKPAKICGRLRRPIDQGKWFRPLHLNDWRPQAMKPVIESHLNYRGFLTRRMQRYWISWRSQPASVREIFLRIRNLDLSAVDRIMMDCYSALGPAPRQPSCMLRSLLLMIMTKCPSIPLWVMTLHMHIPRTIKLSIWPTQLQVFWPKICKAQNFSFLIFQCFEVNFNP